MITALPRFVRDLLASCPTAGTGVNLWLFRCARVLHLFYRDKRELAQLLMAASAQCGRRVTETEVRRAVKHSASCAWNPLHPMTTSTRSNTWPAKDVVKIRELTTDGPSLVDLWESSPFRLDDNAAHGEELIDVLFPGNPLLCCGKSKSEFDTKPREEWRGQLGGQQLIVPSTMTAVFGVTQDGKKSKHAIDNTGPRRYLVTEFDPLKWCDLNIDQQSCYENESVYYALKRDDQAAILIHLAARAPLTLAVFSGSKSMHAWWYCAGQDETKLRKFFAYVVTLGADPATWTRSQFVRMPDAQRDNGKRQSVYYFNPATIKS